MVFPVVMYRYERWTITKAEGRKINAFELWWWRSLLSVPSSARRSNQSILKEIKPEYSFKDWCWSWSSNSLPPDVKNWLIGKDPDIGKDWRQEEKGTTEDEMVGWHHWVNRHEFEQTSLQELVMDTEARRPAGHGVPKSQTRLSNWTEWTYNRFSRCFGYPSFYPVLN